jgi:hypothetical protein
MTAITAMELFRSSTPIPAGEHYFIDTKGLIAYTPQLKKTANRPLLDGCSCDGGSADA